MITPERSLGLYCADSLRDMQPLLESICKEIKIEEVKLNKCPKSIQEYNLTVISDLADFKTDFVMVVQYDGYPLNYSAWRKDFLEYDYIGAPWINQPMPREVSVGNGGFSIRSVKLMRAVKELPYDGSVPEDAFICINNSKHLKDLNFTFAPIEVAYNFSIEDSYYKGQFGFHGKNTVAINRAAGIFK